jgi:hypothetical protein
LRKFLSKIHIWLGMLCAPYMIIFGFSSLHFNHHFSFVETGQHSVNWERQIAVADTSDNKVLAERVRLDLGLMGWVPWWEYRRGEDNSFRFIVPRPGKSYTIKVNPERTLASVEELRYGPLKVINSLHAFGHLPGSNMVKYWSWYTNICVFFVIFAGVSGVYFWSKRKDETLIGWLLLAGVSGGSLLLMIFVWIRG